MTSSSGPEDAGVERAEEQGGYGSPTPEQEAGQEGIGQEGGGRESSVQERGQESAATEEEDGDQGEHDVD